MEDKPKATLSNSESEIGRLFSNLDEQQKLIDHLETRLMPVSHPTNKATAGDDLTPATAHITHACDLVARQNHQLVEILSNLAV